LANNFGVTGIDNVGAAVVDHWAKLEAQARLWFPVWQELANYIQPRKANIIFERLPGQIQTQYMFDSSAPHALELLAASMQGSITPGSQRWLNLRIKGVDYGADVGIEVWLEQCADRIYDAIRNSNFSSESHEVYQDLALFGTALMYEEEKEPEVDGSFGGLRFSTIHPGYFAIDEDADGYVNMVFRRFKMSARAMAAEFGESKISQAVRGQLAKAGTEMYWIIQAVYPRKDPSMIAGPGTYKSMPYVSYWAEEGSKNLLREGGYRDFPYMCPRWSKTTGEIYGRGPGYTALPDVKTLNKAVELKLRAWAKAIDPPIKVRDEGVVGAVRLTPAGLTHVRDMDAVQVLDLGGHFDVADLEEEKIRQAIARIFFADQLQMQEGPQMTAYEVQVRYELMQRILGPTLGRLEVEFLDRLVQRTFWILYRRGVLPEMPANLIQKVKEQGDGKFKLQIHYEGPLAKAQRFQESIAVQRFFQITLPVMEAHPEAADIVNIDEVMKLHALSVGIPARVMNTQAQIEKIRQARADAQQQQAMAQNAESMGKAAPMVAALAQANKAGIAVSPVGSPAAQGPIANKAA